MRHHLITAVTVGVLAFAATATEARTQADEIAELRAQLQALQARIEALERQQASAQASRDPAVEPPAQARANGGAAEWASRIRWKGDLRYRHEQVDAEAETATPEQTRHRIRGRFGLTAQVTETVHATVQVATNGGDDDPRSTNQTLGEGFDRKGVGLDLAYVDWRPVNGLSVQLGKMPLPWKRVGSAFWDNDITPEGGAVQLARGPFFGSAFAYWLSERSAASDTTLTGAQLGLTGTVRRAKLIGAIGYFDVGAARGQVTAQPDGCELPFNDAFFEGAQGNTTLVVDGCPVLANDFDVIQIMGQMELMLGTLPFNLFADVVRNQGARDLDAGYAAGFTLGKAGEARTWEVGYMYQVTEKDAQFGQFVDSDFGGGITDVDGSAIRVGYAPAKNWVLNGTYFLNDRFVDVGAERDYRRLQLDLNFRF